MLRKFFLLFFVLSLLQPNIAKAGGDPDLVWQTLETDHFIIYFYQSEYLIAMKAARVAEEAHVRVTKLLHNVPKKKCVIVITDDTDGANGSATVIPYNLVRIFVTAPAEDSILSDYDDWLRGLIYHEYTHIVHIDTIGGLPNVANKIIGKLWAPNQIEPRWFIEGLATYAESALTTAGRANSTAEDMFLRAAVLENHMLTLDQLSSSPEAWPRGNSFYLFGSAFLGYIAGRFGEESLSTYSHEYGTTAVPYGLNKAAISAFGQDFVSLYDDWLKFLGEKYQQQKVDIEAEGRLEGVQLTTTGEDHNSPIFTPDGEKLIFFESSGQARAGLYMADLGPKSEARAQIKIVTEATQNKAFSSEILAPTVGRASVDITPDGKALYLHQRAITKGFYSYNDLYRAELDTEKSGELSVSKSKRLTTGERASDPTISPDGKWIAYTQNRSGSTSLALVSVDEPTKPKLLVDNADFSQVFTPSFSPDGKKIAFSLWQGGGFRDIAIVDVESGEVKKLMYDRAIDTDPSFSPDGKILYFSSDRTGIANLFAYDFEQEKIYQITNVLNGAFEPNSSPDGSFLIYLGYNSRGFDFYAIPIERDTWREAKEPRTRGTPAYADEPLVSEKEANLEVKKYSPWKTLRPYTYTPILGQDSYGSTLGIAVNGFDATATHSFSLDTQFSTVNGAPTGSASYRYDGLYPTLTASLSRFTSTRRLLTGTSSTPYIEEQYLLSAGASFPIRREFWFSSLSLRYEGQFVRPDDPSFEKELPLDPSDTLPIKPDHGLISGVSLGLNFGSARRFTYSISSEEGFNANVTLRVRDQILGSFVDSKELFWTFDKYIPLHFLGNHHVLALSLEGGVSQSEGRVARAFVLGGLPSQDVFGALTLLNRGFVGGGFLRGFEPGFMFGDRFHILNAEYRFPIARIERGFETIPLYAKKLHGRLFMDYGAAYFDRASPEQFLPLGVKEGQMRTSFGAEVLLDGVLGYFLSTTVRLGVAQGLGPDGIRDYYLLVGAPF
jgi:Tol biopolymer transport system component